MPDPIPPERDEREPTAPMVPRRATLDDMSAIARIHRLAFFGAMPHMPDLHTPEEDLAFYRNIVFPRASIWLIDRSGMNAGFIAFRRGWVEHLYIHPDHQGCGIGRTLLELAKATEHSLHLWTFQCNRRAHRFYERNGFRMERETDGADNDERQPDVLYFWTRNADE